MTGTLYESLLARWREHRRKAAQLEELRLLGPDDAAGIASDLNLTLFELELAIASSAGSGGLMERMMEEAFHLDRPRLNREAPAALRAAEITCARCSAKKRCARELAAGTAARNIDLFCPNADFFSSVGP